MTSASPDATAWGSADVPVGRGAPLSHVHDHKVEVCFNVFDPDGQRNIALLPADAIKPGGQSDVDRCGSHDRHVKGDVLQLFSGQQKG